MALQVIFPSSTKKGFEECTYPVESETILRAAMLMMYVYPLWGLPTHLFLDDCQLLCAHA